MHGKPGLNSLGRNQIMIFEKISEQTWDGGRQWISWSPLATSLISEFGHPPMGLTIIRQYEKKFDIKFRYTSSKVRWGGADRIVPTHIMFITEEERLAFLLTWLNTQESAIIIS